MRPNFLNLKFSFLSLFTLLLADQAFATYIDFNYLNFSDQFIATTTNQNTRSIYDLNLGFEATNNKQVVLALSIGSSKISDVVGSTSTSFSTSDLGIKFLFFWSKNRTWSSSLIYNFTSNAKYNDGTNGEVALRGTSIKADIGYNFWLGDYTAIGLKFYYYVPSFSESVTNNYITNVSFKRTLIYPNISFIFSF